MQGQRAVPHSRSSLAQGAGAINAVLKKAAARGAHCIHAYTGAWQVAFVHMGHPGRRPYARVRPHRARYILVAIYRAVRCENVIHQTVIYLHRWPPTATSY